MSKHPLGPVSQGFIEPRLLGTWHCEMTPADEEYSSSVLTIVDFDGREYYMMSTQKSNTTAHSRGHATLIGSEPFLNVRRAGAGDDHEWWFAAYSFKDDDHVALRFVDPSSFKAVVDRPKQVRKQLERTRHDSGIFLFVDECVRAPEPSL